MFQSILEIQTLECDFWRPRCVGRMQGQGPSQGQAGFVSVSRKCVLRMPGGSAAGLSAGDGSYAALSVGGWRLLSRGVWRFFLGLYIVVTGTTVVGRKLRLTSPSSSSLPLPLPTHPKPPQCPPPSPLSNPSPPPQPLPKNPNQQNL